MSGKAHIISSRYSWYLALPLLESASEVLLTGEKFLNSISYWPGVPCCWEKMTKKQK